MSNLKKDIYCYFKYDKKKSNEMFSTPLEVLMNLACALEINNSYNSYVQ